MPSAPPMPDAAADRIRVKRIYRAARVSDGKRVLVDRLWPRGMSKDRARLHSWCREIAPSDDLRRWYHAHPDQWEDFVARYRHELTLKDDLTSDLASMAVDAVLTLLFASSAETRNNAIVLRDHLRHRLEEMGDADARH